MLSLLIASQIASNLVLPSYTAYVLQAGVPVDNENEAGIQLKGSLREVLWGGYLARTGLLTIRPTVADTVSHNGYRLSIKGPNGTKLLSRKPDAVDFGPIEISTAGWYQFKLALNRESEAGVVKGLTLTGPAIEGAKFNLKPRTNAASVHIRYPVEKSTQIEWFYNEVKAQTDPPHTFYMACGFSRGYFGMQVNSETERRIIFSIWDSGNEAVDRAKVSDENRVKLLAKGKDVVADSFGNEGTGGHSHLVTPWRTKDRQRFLVHAQRDGNATIYTGYYFSPEARSWTLVSSFRAPKDGGLLQSPHSFVENFWGINGNLKRSAEYGSTWIKPIGGDWQQMKTAQFSHDATGGKDRFDYDLTAKNGQFVLQNGGFEGASPAFGVRVSVSESSKPKIDLEHLPSK